MTILHSHKLLRLRLFITKLTTRATSQALNERLFFYLYVFFPH
jgi:hypothetical protein